MLEHDIVVFTEGKTDIMHLELALLKLREKGEFRDIKIAFLQWLFETTGETALEAQLYWMKKHNVKMGACKVKTLYLFDRDIKRPHDYHVKINNNEFPKLVMHNVWAFILPVPSFRPAVQNSSISIEHYLPDDILFSEDKDGRRLYWNAEFIDKELNTDSAVICKKSGADKEPYTIIDQDVKRGSESLACTKNNFARRFYSQELDYPEESLDAFRTLFDKIKYCCES